MQFFSLIQSHGKHFIIEIIALRSIKHALSVCYCDCEKYNNNKCIPIERHLSIFARKKEEEELNEWNRAKRRRWSNFGARTQIKAEAKSLWPKKTKHRMHTMQYWICMWISMLVCRFSFLFSFCLADYSNILLTFYEKIQRIDFM